MDCTITFIDEHDEFRVMALGARQVLGALDTVSYERVLTTVAGNWGARFARPEDTLIPGDINAGGGGVVEEMVIASTCSDMGPGTHGAFRQLVGTHAHIPCCAHGANGINRDIAES